MTGLSRQVARRSFSTVFSLATMVAFCLFFILILLPGQVRAADAAGTGAATVSKAEVDRLVATLEDPAARQKLEANLKLLVAADKAGQESEDPGLLSMLSDEVQDISDEVLATASALADVGHMADWIKRQMTDPGLRLLWATVLGKLAAILGGGLIAERLAIFALTAPRHMIERHRPSNRWLRIPYVLGRGCLDLLPIAIFVFCAQILRSLSLLALDGDARQAASMLIMAYVLVRFVLVLARALLMPGSRALRPLPLDDEAAAYLFVWARRLTMTGVWGYYLVQALKLLGLPKSGYNFSLKVLGLVFASLLVLLILQRRQVVRQWIRRQGESRRLSGAVRGLRNRFADVWHVLACLYIAAAFVIWALQVKGGFEFILQASMASVVILGVANLLAGVLIRLVERVFSVSEVLRGRFPNLEWRANRYLALMQSMMRGLVVVIAVLALAQAWGGNVISWLASDLGRRLVSSAVSIAAVLLGALVVWEVVNASIERYLAHTGEDGQAVERSARARTLLPLLRNVVMVVLIVVVSLIVLSELGVNIAPLLAGAGVVGVAIGFGSQKLVQDVITGAFILFENTLAVGDAVKIGEYTGTVEGMTIRTMRLRDANGQIHTLPFSNVNSVTNLSRDFGYHIINIGVSYQEDVDRVMAVITDLGAEMAKDADWASLILEPIEVYGVEKFTDSAVIIGGRLKTPPGKQAPVGREFNRRLKKRFDELGISIPYPTTTLYFGEQKDGQVAPVPVKMQEAQ